jgi:hypothetical protein
MVELYTTSSEALFRFQVVSAVERNPSGSRLAPTPEPADVT